MLQLQSVQVFLSSVGIQTRSLITTHPPLQNTKTATGINLVTWSKLELNMALSLLGVQWWLLVVNRAHMENRKCTSACTFEFCKKMCHFSNLCYFSVQIRRNGIWITSQSISPIQVCHITKRPAYFWSMLDSVARIEKNKKYMAVS